MRSVGDVLVDLRRCLWRLRQSEDDVQTKSLRDAHRDWACARACIYRDECILLYVSDFDCTMLKKA